MGAVVVLSGPDFAGVLEAHRRTSDAYSPLCACGKWRDKRDDGTRHRAHVAAALNAELVRWLGSDEPARVLSREVYEDDRGPTFRVRSALTALAALTGSDQ